MTNRQFSAQKAALTRAQTAFRRTGDAAPLRAAVEKAVAQWNADGPWPDDWARWQRALDDALGYRCPDITDPLFA